MNGRSPFPRQTFLLMAVLLGSGYVRFEAQTAGAIGGTRPVQLPLSASQASGVIAQQSSPAPSGSSGNVQIQVPGSYAGSVPGPGIGEGLVHLALADAIRRGLSVNLGLISSNNAVEQAKAQRAEARSSLLPEVTVEASENAAKVNLAAEGFSASAFGTGLGGQFPTSVGPFHYYDLHGALRQSVLDLTALHNLRSESEVYRASSLSGHQAREEVVLAVTGVYLQLVSDVALAQRQQAEVSLAEATYKQAQAQVDAGNKAPIEASRSLVELQTEKQRLRSQLGEVQKRGIQLCRLIGLPLGTQVEPADHLAPLASDVPMLTVAVTAAWSQRFDLKAAEAQLKAAQEVRKSASSQRLPAIAINGTYGLEGTNPNEGSTVFQAQASLSVPIFEGGRIRAEVAQADAVVRQRQADLTNQRAAVEAEVRNAFIDLQVANDRVALAGDNRKLAAQTLQQSQDRFSVGVADSVEVVNSQQSLASADQDSINSLFAQYVARIDLAHAMGEAERDAVDMFERKTP